jgi:GNAT superfamily N-acetyltransferase
VKPPAGSVAFRIRRAAPEDALVLAGVGARTIHDTYSSNHTPEELETHIAANFTPDHTAAELADSSSVTFLALVGEEACGYATLRVGPAPECVIGPAPVELARIYLTKETVGKGVGSALLRACLEEARRLGRETIWLGVWDENARAVAFYGKWGFRPTGTHRYVFGGKEYEDLVMMRSVTGGDEPHEKRPPAGGTS